MEFMTGVNQKEVKEISDLAVYLGEKVKVNGTIHTIRDMGTVVFVILRKREGLLQLVLDESVNKIDKHSLKEGAAIEAFGLVTENEKAPNGIEISMEEVIILSEPAEPMPVPINKWKMNIALETNLNLRPVTLRNIRERANSEYRKPLFVDFVIFYMRMDLLKFTHLKSVPKGLKVGQIFSRWIISTNLRY